MDVFVRFTPLVEITNEDNIVCYENTVLFCVCSFLMINVAVAFASGAPYRRPMYTNRETGVVDESLQLSDVLVVGFRTFSICYHRSDVPHYIHYRVATKLSY